MLDVNKNSVKGEPVYNPHRTEIGADDSTPPTHSSGGCSPTGFQYINLDVELHAATTQAILNIYYWSDLSEKFIIASPAVTWTLTASRMLTFEPRGRTFWVAITGLTGVTKQASVNVSGYGRLDE